jgi:hypothetical protein
MRTVVYSNALRKANGRFGGDGPSKTNKWMSKAQWREKIMIMLIMVRRSQLKIR